MPFFFCSVNSTYGEYTPCRQKFCKRRVCPRVLIFTFSRKQSVRESKCPAVSAVTYRSQDPKDKSRAASTGSALVILKGG